MKVVILTEANEDVASGHLLESIVLAHELQQVDCSVLFLINEDMQSLLKKRIDFSYYEYQVPLIENFDKTIEIIQQWNPDCIITNLRLVKNEFLSKLKHSIASISLNNIPLLICIDELGRRSLSDADVIVNPMIDSYYWIYPDTDCMKYCGQEYLILPENLSVYHEKKKHISKGVQVVTVSMGGVDKPGTTLKLAKWLPEILPNVRLNLVCGGGFPYVEKLREIIDENENIKVFYNIDFLYQLFYESDLAFCAGGNTLHELAAIGTPSIVIPSMPHELSNGKKFQDKGFCITIDEWKSLCKDDLMYSLEMLRNKHVRDRMSLAGKKIVDGMGKLRMQSIILYLLIGLKNKMDK